MGQHFTKDADIERILKPYHYIKEIDEKNYGKGTLLKRKQNNMEHQEFLKVIEFKNKKDFMKTYLEFKERLELKNEYIIQLKEMHMKIDEKIFETNYILFLTLEYTLCSLEHYQLQRGKEKKRSQGVVVEQESVLDICLFEAIYLVDSLVQGTLYLESKGLNRGDIQPTNVMLTSNKNYKLLDNALFIHPHSIQVLSNSSKKTIRYLAPEQLSFLSFKNKKNQKKEEGLFNDVVESDRASVFQIGVIMLQTLLNESQQSLFDYKFKVVKWDILVIQINQIKTLYGEPLSQLLTHMLAEQVTQRYSLIQAARYIADGSIISSHQYADYATKRKTHSDNTLATIFNKVQLNHHNTSQMESKVLFDIDNNNPNTQHNNYTSYNNNNQTQQMNNNQTQQMNNNQSMISQQKNSFQVGNQEMVKEEYKNGSVYEGEKKQGQRHGRGRFTYEDGAYYEGQWNENKIHGRGILYFPSLKTAYSGDWVQDHFQGFGTLYNQNVDTSSKGDKVYMDFKQVKDGWDKYEGDFNQDKKDGFGMLYLADGSKYSGKFKDDQVHGKGTFYKKDGSLISGNWEHNKYV